MAESTTHRDGGDDNAPVRVLVVEDEEILAQFLIDILGDDTFHVVGPGTTLPEALKLATNEAIDVALLDVNLGGVPVTAVADKLHERRIPFLFVSGSERLTEPRFAKVPVLRKPFMTDDLFGGIEAVLPARLRPRRLKAS